jgi:hypothetical protein
MTGKKPVVIIAMCFAAALLAFSPKTHGASKDSGKKGFSGKWKGELPAPSFGGRGGAQPLPGGQRFVQRGGGGGRGFGGGGGFPGGNRGAFGPQKITLNIKTKDNDTKATGNVVIGDNQVDDIKVGKIDGNNITFKGGTFEYSGVLDGDQMMMTRTPDATGGRGGGPAIKFTLKRS